LAACHREQPESSRTRTRAAIRRAATHLACRHRSRAKHGSCAIISGPRSRCENLYGCVLYREVWLAMADLTVPLIAAGAVVVGALAGQVSTIVGTVIKGRRDRTTAQEERRREAYAAFINATQGILQALSGLPPIEKSLESNAAERALRGFAELQRTWATVVIAGTLSAWEASNAVKDTTGSIVNLLQSDPTEVPRDWPERLTIYTHELRERCDGFVIVAREELN